MGYGYSSAHSSSGDITAMLVILLILVLIAWFFSIPMFIEAAKKKGHFETGGTGMLWFVGLLATPIVVGLYVAALPDLKLREALEAAMSQRPVTDELPEL